MSEDRVSEYVAVPAEGERIGLLVCKLCGAAILLASVAPSAVETHMAWHEGPAIVDREKS